MSLIQKSSLSFTKNSVHAECSCPVKDEWCKHAIALGIKTIKDGIYDNYLLKKHKIKPDLSDEENDGDSDEE